MAEVELGEWIYKHVEVLTDGVDGSVRADLIGEGNLASALNVFFYKKQVRVDTGYKAFLSTTAVRGNPRVVWQFFLTDGSSELLLVTNTTVYKLLNSKWQYVASSVSTTLTVAAVATDTAMTVADITGFANGDFIGIALDNGDQHQTTVNGAPAGSTINITDAMPSGAAIGNVVVEAVALSGSDDIAVSVLTIPFKDWFVFTNGVDNPQYYDATSCQTIPNLPSSGNTQCRAVALYNNYLILINTKEGGTSKPQRIRWSDTADPEEWTTGNAGFRDLVDIEDFLLTGEPLGPYLILYRERSIYRVEYVGSADLLFQIDPMITGEGALSHDSVANLGDYHALVGNANVYEYRGSFDLDPIGDEIYEKVFSIDGEMIPSFKQRVFILYAEELDELFMFYPAGTDEYPTHIARYRVDTRAWTFRQLANSVSGYGLYERTSSQAWSELVGSWAVQDWNWVGARTLANAPITLLLADDTDTAYEYDYISQDDIGTAIDWELVTKAFIRPQEKLRHDYIEFRAKGSTVDIHYRTDIDGSWVFLATKTLSATVATYRAHGQFVGDCIQFKFSGSGPGFILEWIAFKYKPETEF